MYKVGELPSLSYVILAMAAIGGAVALWWQIGPTPVPAAGIALHAHGLLGSRALARIFVASNLLTGLSYVTISATLAYLVYRARQAIPFHWIVLAFGTFILACGSGHFTEVLVLWYPAYWLQSGVHSLTAFASVMTAVLLPPLVPRALRLIGDAQQTDKHKRRLERANADLQLEVAERRRLAEELRRQRDLYEQLLQGLSDLGEAVMFGDGDRFVFVNDAFCGLSGYSRDELLNGMTLPELAAPNQASASAERLARLRDGQDIGSFEGALRHKSGWVIPLDVSSKVVERPEGTQFLSVMRDITARHEAARALEASQARLAGILDTADDAIIALDERRTIALFNQGAERIFGYHAAKMIGQSIDLLLPADLQARHQQHITDFAAAPEIARKMGERQQIHGRRADGSEFPAEASIAKLLLDDQAIFTVILRDITARLQAEQRLRTSLTEKEVLLKEVHHRVKNNLQVIISLLRLQAHSPIDQAAVEPLRDCQNRVLAMALVHEQLYGSRDLARLDFAQYIARLSASVLRSYEADVGRIRIALHVPQQALLDLETAIPLGLILTELLTNSVKHAFPAGHSGMINIAFTIEQAIATLLVQDDGIGMADELDPSSLASLGLKLIRRLVDQLDGTLDIQRNGGLTMQIRVPLHTEEHKDDSLHLDRRG
jgi:PAS domain S-box-containing protein